MVDSVDSLVVLSTPRRRVVRLTAVSDGTGESAVAKVDISTLIGPTGSAPTRTVVEAIEYDIQGYTSIRLFWDHNTPDEIAMLGAGQGYLDWRAAGGLVDPSSTGGTGDITLTTVGHSSGDVYTITLWLRLK